MDTLLAQYWIINNIFYNTVHLFSTVTGRGHFWFTRFCRGHDILTRGNVIICHGYKILISGNVILTRGNVYIYIYAFSRWFYPKRLTVNSVYNFICPYVCSLGIDPQTFVLLTQCSTTEPQEYYVMAMRSTNLRDHNNPVLSEMDSFIFYLELRNYFIIIEIIT